MSDGRGWHRQRGQALLEFAISAVPFFLAIYGSLGVVLHSVEEQVAVNAAARGARLAVLASSDDLVSADYSNVAPLVKRTIAGTMFGTTVVEQPLGPCPVDAPEATVYICTTVETDNVTVAVKGRPAGLIPGRLWQMDEEVTGHLIRFRR